MSAEPESDCGLSDDGDKLESDNEMVFPARCMCVSDLSALMEEKYQAFPAQLAPKDLACRLNM